MGYAILYGAPILVSTIAILLGLLGCSYLGLGFGFSHLGRDILKAFILAAIIIGACIGLLSLTSNARVLVVIPIIWVIVIKLLWFDLEKAEIGVVFVAWLAIILFFVFAIAVNFPAGTEVSHSANDVLLAYI